MIGFSLVITGTRQDAFHSDAALLPDALLWIFEICTDKRT
jgi:hypothetical protein